jgi:hypothetical protein
MTQRLTDHEKHRRHHVELHNGLDDLLADFISHTGKLPAKTSILELLKWSYKQTEDPDEPMNKSINDPGDYYRAKREQAEEIQAEISRHELYECWGAPRCKKCRELERKLEMARYVGD